MSRRTRHGLLALFIGLTSAVAAVAGDLSGLIDRLSITTAYLCAGLFCGVLLVGPLETLRSGRRPVNNILRRDLGIWTTFTGLAHLCLGMVASMNPAYLEQYVEKPLAPPASGLRMALFSWGTITGFVVGVIFLLLLALSNNGSIRILGTRWWKRLQRSSYLAFALTAVHGFAFQVLESRNTLWIVILALVVILVMAGQLAALGMKWTDR